MKSSQRPVMNRPTDPEAVMESFPDTANEPEGGPGALIEKGERRYAMTATLEKPRIQCRHRGHEGRQCPLDALEKQEYCFFHLPG